MFARIRQFLGHRGQGGSDTVVPAEMEGETFEEVQLDDFEASGGGIGVPLLPPGPHGADAFEVDSEAPRDSAP